MILGIVMRKAMLIFHGQADVSFVGKIKAGACWWS